MKTIGILLSRTNLSVLLVLLFLLSCRTQSDVGLVLGGGGAKAAAEIGVLKVVDSLDVQVKYVVGSSMGSVVGGLYAAGYTAKEIEQMWLTEDWLKLFDESKCIGSEDGYRTFFGLIRGDEFEHQLRRALKAKGCETFEDIQDKRGVTFCCTATEIVDYRDLKEDHLVSGDLASAIRASMTYPAPIVGYPMIDREGKILVDGGMLNNLPVDVAESLGAQQIIAVDLEMLERNEHPSPLKGGLRILYDVSMLRRIVDMTKYSWLVEWLFDNKDVVKHNANKLNPDIIYISPANLRFKSILSFQPEDARDMIMYGEYEARKYIHKFLLLNQ